MISTKFKIRERNESNILNMIINKKEISRAELAELTNLNKASVSSITKSLLDEGLVVESRIGDASTQGGRKPIMLQFNGKSALAISFDVASNYIQGMLSYIDGTIINIIAKENFPINSKNVVKEMSNIIDEFNDIQPKTIHGIIGITTAIHGVVNDNIIEFTPYYDLANINLYELITQKYDTPFFIYNEANLAAMGEYTFSSSHQSLVSISVHNGIGAGIVKNGELELGDNGHAGEIGHTILFPDGRSCPCGNSGCIERYASNAVFYEQIAEELNLEFVNGDIIRLLWEQKNIKVIEKVQQIAKFISIAINNIVMLHDPEIVILNSYLYLQIPEIINMITKNLKSRFATEVIVRNTKLGSRTILLGGVAIAAQEFLKIKQLKLIDRVN